MKVGDLLYFGTVRAAHGYLHQVGVTPNMGNMGMPETKDNALCCTRKIYNALINLGAVWDKNSHPDAFKKFLPGGAWADPMDLQAITFIISVSLGAMHKDKQLGPPLRFSEPRD